MFTTILVLVFAFFAYIFARQVKYTREGFRWRPIAAALTGTALGCLLGFGIDMPLLCIVGGFCLPVAFLYLLNARRLGPM